MTICLNSSSCRVYRVYRSNPTCFPSVNSKLLAGNIQWPSSTIKREKARQDKVKTAETCLASGIIKSPPSRYSLGRNADQTF